MGKSKIRSKQTLIDMLRDSHQYIKKLRKQLRNARIQRNKYRATLAEIERYAESLEVTFDRYGMYSDNYYERIDANRRLQAEIFRILKGES